MLLFGCLLYIFVSLLLCYIFINIATHKEEAKQPSGRKLEPRHLGLCICVVIKYDELKGVFMFPIIASLKGCLLQRHEKFLYLHSDLSGIDFLRKTLLPSFALFVSSLEFSLDIIYVNLKLLVLLTVCIISNLFHYY